MYSMFSEYSECTRHNAIHTCTYYNRLQAEFTQMSENYAAIIVPSYLVDNTLTTTNNKIDVLILSVVFKLL